MVAVASARQVPAVQQAGAACAAGTGPVGVADVVARVGGVEAGGVDDDDDGVEAGGGTLGEAAAGAVVVTVTVDSGAVLLAVPEAAVLGGALPGAVLIPGTVLTTGSGCPPRVDEQPISRVSSSADAA